MAYTSVRMAQSSLVGVIPQAGTYTNAGICAGTLLHGAVTIRVRMVESLNVGAVGIQVHQ